MHAFTTIYPQDDVQVCGDRDNFRHGHLAFTWKRGNIHLRLNLLVNFNNTKEAQPEKSVASITPDTETAECPLKSGNKLML